jgi:hypothetical protein
MRASSAGADSIKSLEWIGASSRSTRSGTALKMLDCCAKPHGFSIFNRSQPQLAAGPAR